MSKETGVAVLRKILSKRH